VRTYRVRISEKAIRIKELAYVDLRLEFFDGFDGAGSNDYLATVDLFTLDTTEQGTHVVASFTLYTGSPQC
jgi:hypothetical protein